MYKYTVLEKLLFPPINLSEWKLRVSLQGKTILITGASSGIGEQLAYLLADLDVHLILVARREEKLLTIKNEIEKKAAKVSVFCADLRNTEEMEGLLLYVHQLCNGVDVLVSNAGLSINRSITHSLNRFHDFNRTMAINYFAPVQLHLSFIPLLKKKHGHVINISTINALTIPIPYWAAYQASKSAFDTWFRSVSPELNAMGIATTSFYLPLVRTPMILPTTSYQNMPAMSPEHVAKMIGKSMYTKKKVFKPWWLIFCQLASILFRGSLESFMIKMVRKKGKSNEDR